MNPVENLSQLSQLMNTDEIHVKSFEAVGKSCWSPDEVLNPRNPWGNYCENTLEILLRLPESMRNICIIRLETTYYLGLYESDITRHDPLPRSYKKYASDAAMGIVVDLGY